MRIFLPIAVFVTMSAVLVFLAAGYESARNLTALIAGTSAYSLMAFNLVLAARLPGMEAVFGGLDQVYKLHKWSGIAVLGALLVHTQLKFIQLEGLVPPGTLAETAVEIAKPAFIALAVLILLSAVKRVPRIRVELPWMWWRVTHWLIVPIFLIVSFHQVFVKAPFESTSAVRLWLYGVGLAGIGAILWIIFAPLLRKHAYEVVGITHLAEATQVTARPMRRPIKARAGQFAFLSVAREGLREPHPFTLSALRDNGEVEFCIQPAGDFTRRLKQDLQLGDRLALQGGYGHFDFHRGGRCQIWLAGGIGITPFLAMAESYAQKPQGHEVVLIHAVRHAQLAVCKDRLQAIAAAHPNFTFFLHVSAETGRLNAAMTEAYAPFSLPDVELWYCGPKAMRVSIIGQWRAQGRAPHKIHFEEFEFR